MLKRTKLIEEKDGSGSVDITSVNESTEQVAKKFLKLNSEEEAIADAERVADITGLSNKVEYLKKGSILINLPNLIDSEIFSLTEKEQFRNSTKHPWDQPLSLYFLAVTSAMSAAVQGIDESAVGGAQLFYVSVFGIDKDTSRDANIQGLINSVPYLSASIVGCWLSIPANKYFGRRTCIFWASFIAAASGLWQAFSPSWHMLLAGRFIMGITIGIKSATVPVYTAESTPHNIRGGLVMLWQTFTAFGVMWGSIVGVIFLNSGKNNWRYMLGSVFPLPLVVCSVIYFVPESPRWLLKNNRSREAYNSFLKLRKNELIAARDFYYTYTLMELERNTQEQSWYKNLLSLLKIPRNRSAALASGLLMFGQQFCGVNVLTFYISVVLTAAGFSNRDALSGSCGFGALAVCGALTAIPIIDRKGRRFLVLTTYPLLAVFLLWTAFSFYAKDTNTRLGLVLTGIYLYVYLFGIGSGPVPFTYNAESASIIVRDIHSSLGTSITWLFCFILGFTLPNMQRKMKNEGVFCFYAAWCVLLFVLIYFFVPETKGYTLEELDLIFEFPIREHALFQFRYLKTYLNNITSKEKKQYESIKSLALKYKTDSFSKSDIFVDDISS